MPTREGVPLLEDDCAKRGGEGMKRIEIEGRVICPRPGYVGYQDLSDCMACDYHVGLEANYVVCAFAQGKKKVEE